ncbi:hypothetical protein GJ744_001486 [Endocarpon pusillum]|uniref:FHA domain-containing protein n=1 Tax=Endocarpon pusillum TaxID=364733 RepID=A0A8H7E0M4_9EURO|nr:hypothetical protein GJ744_001486 [Endocarpon pusillum]
MALSLHYVVSALASKKLNMAPSPKRKISSAPPVAGAKRTAASLLPAFEPFSSSPMLPRGIKRSRHALSEIVTYPTPVPTSSTAVPSSSPPAQSRSRQSSNRAYSTVSERAPLADVPSIELPRDGKKILMGRSSATCDYQLSSNRLISRVHVTACFKPASSNLKQDQIEITCAGWNGIKIHCRGKAVVLSKGDTFTSCHRDLDVIVDAQDSRICVKWPSRDDTPFSSGSSDEESSPSRRPRYLKRHSTPPSPHLPQQQIASPVSPSPAVQPTPNVSIPSSPPSLLQPTGGPVIVYEDKSLSPEHIHHKPMTASQTTVKMPQPASVLLAQSQDSLLSVSQDFSDRDEENDPIIHSFGPFGANLLPRMASFTTGDSLITSPRKESRARPEPLKSSASPPQARKRSNSFDLKTHVINQLAFSRLSSTPLSTILSHFPDDAGDCSGESVKEVIAQTSCIGEVTREGKDAAGRPLESEYYYIPDEDEDEMRREAVVNDLRKPGLRACRKQHKQYYWRKPK